MDTSEQYIKMCDCPKIQDSRLKGGLVHGDYYHARAKHPSSVDIFIDPKRLWSGEIVNAFIWLPRQDQLQEMVLEKKQTTLLEPVARLCLHFDKFIHPDNYCLHGDRESGMYNYEYCQECVVKGNLLFQQFTSMKQLWLAFVMKEKFNKTWDGETWR